MIIVPWSFGCMPSLKLNSGFCATPSSRNGINCKLYFLISQRKFYQKISYTQNHKKLVQSFLLIITLIFLFFAILIISSKLFFVSLGLMPLSISLAPRHKIIRSILALIKSTQLYLILLQKCFLKHFH